MGSHILLVVIALTLLTSCSNNRSFPNSVPLSDTRITADQSYAAQMLFLTNAERSREAIELYLKTSQEQGSHNFELLELLARSILQKEAQSKNAASLLRAIYGAGISKSSHFYSLFREGITSFDPQTELASLNFLSQLHDDRADALLEIGMRSRHLLINLETAYHLAEKKQKLEQIEALYYKVPKDLKPLFPQLFTLYGTHDATKILHFLLSDRNPKVRMAAINSAIDEKRDDLLPMIRALSSQLDPSQQEACAKAFGALKDDYSIARLKSMKQSNDKNVSLTASYSLFLLGFTEERTKIEASALKHNLFAIQMLSQIEESRHLLKKLINSDNIQVRLNATLALLEQKDPTCLVGLPLILLRNGDEILFKPFPSPGWGTTAFKVTASYKESSESLPLLLETSLKIRETALIKASQLPEEQFLFIAKEIFNSRQTELIPTLIRLLETVGSKQIIDLLQQQQQKVGSPLTRDYCNLALYRLKAKGPYEDNLKEWLKNNEDAPIIQFRPFIPWKLRQSNTPYQLTPEEKSNLLIESFSLLAFNQSSKNIETLLHFLSRASKENQPILAGLLIQAIAH